MIMSLPFAFCWTRVGVEAGQPLESIFRRKEEERAANGGLFFWGIGSAIGPSIAELVRQSPQPEVMFSPIKSAARSVDVKPESVVAWTSAQRFDGSKFVLPAQALITSRFDSSKPKGAHYALVCSSDTPLDIPKDYGTLDIGGLVNLLTGRRVGASQVTAVVRQAGAPVPTRRYNVVLRAKLEAPFLLRLGSPVFLSGKGDKETWDSVVRDTWTARLPLLASS